MKLRSIRNFWLTDQKTGKLLYIKKHQDFELDTDKPEQARVAFELLGGSVLCIDTAYIPAKARYKVVYGFTVKNADGTSRSYSPGQESEFTQEEASKRMMSGHVRPVNQSQWRPTLLINGGSVSKAEPKPLFDGVERESWVRKYIRGD